MGSSLNDINNVTGEVVLNDFAKRLERARIHNELRDSKYSWLLN